MRKDIRIKEFLVGKFPKSSVFLRARSDAVASSISAASRWSSLSRIGSSRIAQITILAPILGYFLIFNSEISKLLDVLSIGSSEDTDAGALIRWAYESRTYFLYFGLVLFGLGAALFRVLAPTQTTLHATSVEYASNMPQENSQTVVRRSFENLLGMYINSLSEDQKEPTCTRHPESFPISVKEGLHRITEVAFERCDISERKSEIACLYTGPAGTLSPKEIIESYRFLDDPVRREIWNELGSAVQYIPSDVYFYEYEALDFSRFRVRLLVFLFFSSGVVLLFIPSLLTQMRILGIF